GDRALRVGMRHEVVRELLVERVRGRLALGDGGPPDEGGEEPGPEDDSQAHEPEVARIEREARRELEEGAPEDEDDEHPDVEDDEPDLAGRQVVDERVERRARDSLAIRRDRLPREGVDLVGELLELVAE